VKDITQENKNMKTSISSANSTKVFALGGLEEIGKNMYCFEYQDEIFIIDTGVKFPSAELLGIDYIIPDFDYLKKNESKIKGIIITHGHEDHIGGVPFILKTLNIPILYSGPMAMELIKSKLKEHKMNINTKFEIYEDDSVFTSKFFKISFFRVVHSIPDAFGIVLETPAGRYVYTGDYKVEFNNLNEKVNFSRITQLGDAGVDLMLSDSTNSMQTEQIALSEKTIANNIHKIMERSKGRFIVSTFASNVNRVNHVIESAYKLGRKILPLGKSMEKNVLISRKLKYTDLPNSAFIKQDQMGSYKDHEILIVCTGSQGEEMAALSRMARGEHRIVKLKNTDTVILSSSPIPGNNYDVNALVNNLTKSKVNLILNDDKNKVHASGHGSSYELQLMISLLQPKYFMPVHGEVRMLKQHKKLAMEVGVPEENIFVQKLGDILEVNKNGVKYVKTVKAGPSFVGGGHIHSNSVLMLRDRQILSQEGTLIVILKVSKKNMMIARRPNIISKGFISNTNREELYELELFLYNLLAKVIFNKDTEKKNKQLLVAELSKIIDEKYKKSPIILTLIQRF
jgi:ribonuclease J